MTAIIDNEKNLLDTEKKFEFHTDFSYWYIGILV